MAVERTESVSRTAGVRRRIRRDRRQHVDAGRGQRHRKAGVSVRLFGCRPDACRPVAGSRWCIGWRCRSARFECAATSAAFTPRCSMAGTSASAADRSPDGNRAWCRLQRRRMIWRGRCERVRALLERVSPAARAADDPAARAQACGRALRMRRAARGCAASRRAACLR